MKTTPLIPIVAVFLTGTVSASDVLIINGSGSSTIAAPLTAAGFGVIQDSFRPGAIADHLGVANSISQVWIWNDGTFGNTYSPVVPALAFSAADQTALTVFNTVHNKWIMDGLSWRGNGNASEQNFTKNEGLNLQTAGGGIVLGADDASGAAIVQHVNQVAGWFNFNLWGGIYSTPPASQHTGGDFFTSPFVIDPTQIVGTTTYSEVPNGAQPNGLFLGTALFGSGTALPAYGPSPVLADQVFDGVTYPNVNHVVTTTIPGASIDVPEPATYAGVFGFAAVGWAVWRRRSR